MDSSKILEGTSSNESGWTMYIASPVDDYNLNDEEDDDDVSIDKPDRFRARDYGRDNDSDDSMASDASSGPSQQEHVSNHGRGGDHAGEKDTRKWLGKKHKQGEEKKPLDEKIKAAKEKSVHKGNSGGRLKKK